MAPPADEPATEQTGALHSAVPGSWDTTSYTIAVGELRLLPARGVSARPTPRLRRPHRLGSRADLVVQAEPPYTLWAGSRSAQLSPSEARLLALLRQEAGQIIAHARLATAVSGDNTVSRNNL